MLGFSQIIHKVIILFITIFLSTQCFSASINNGNFQTGDFSGWSQDVDGFGAPILGLNDFTITQPTAGNFAASIEADFWSTPGDTFSTPQDEAFFANTLFQPLDLVALAGQDLVLSFDWTFSGEQSLFDENFVVGLGDGSGNYFGSDGNLGFLLNPLSYGSGTFSTVLDSSFANALGWSLEFQMNSGFDGFGSFALIDNISLKAVSPAMVPAPPALWLIATGLLGLISVHRKNKV